MADPPIEAAAIGKNAMVNDAKTYDGLTARFLASVATSMPKLSASVMQEWIESPKDLKMALSQKLSEGCEMTISTTKNIGSGSLGEIFDDRWRRNINESVESAAPRQESNRGTIHYFREKTWLTLEELLKKYEQRGLVPANPYFFATVMADTYVGPSEPCVTVWQDAGGKWCFISVQRQDHSILVEVDYVREAEWQPNWYFAGEYE